MTAISMDRCEMCKKTAEDRYIHKGWIHVEGDHSIAISIRRDVNGQAKSRYMRHSGSTDFCSIKCFLKWIESIK